MFVGHYGASFAARRVEATIPLWVLFLAVQLLDVVWAPLVLLGIEKVRIVPGFTASNPLDLYYMPYTHGLLAAVIWSCAAGVAFRFFARSRLRASVVVGLAVFSHWVLDFLVHRPDLPLYGNSEKVGLGLWNLPVLALALEALSLFGGIWLCAGKLRRPRAVIVFGFAMLAIQCYVFFGPPPASAQSAALTALAAYATFAAVIWRLEKGSDPIR
jgi:membrane-bound metal-dependent hydrolase YbcI (DUF457 family)